MLTPNKTGNVIVVKFQKEAEPKSKNVASPASGNDAIQMHGKCHDKLMMSGL